MNAITSTLRRRVLTGLAMAILLVLVTPSRTSAHDGDADPVAANYRSVITDPGADGLTWTSRGGDGLVELTNDTGGEVVVFGYQTEPYLWFVPGDGVYRNSLSPATYLNEDRFGDVDMPPGTSATAAPDWVKVGTDDSFAWHDHRAHWMSQTDPPMVMDDPDREHLVLEFEIPLQVGDAAAVAASGDLRWLPDVAWWPPIAVLVAAASAAVVAVALATRPRDDRWAALARASTIAVLLVVAANVVRVIDDLGRSPTPSERSLTAITAVVTFAAVIALCVRAWRGHPRGFGALGVAAIMVMLFYGSGAAAELSSPQLDTELPEWVRRWTIAASYAVVAPALVAVAIAAWWYARSIRDTAPDELPIAAPST